MASNSFAGSSDSPSLIVTITPCSYENVLLVFALFLLNQFIFYLNIVAATVRGGSEGIGVGVAADGGGEAVGFVVGVALGRAELGAGDDLAALAARDGVGRAGGAA